MTGRIEKSVFISYRRTNLPWALFIYQNLTMHGYDVFFDYQSIYSGNFEKVILDNIRARAHFIVVLTPSALENCKNPSDWLRREIETAMDENRNIVPLMVENFDFGSPLVKEALTGKLSTLNTYNGLPVPNAYALEAMDRLRERYLNKALSDVPTQALQLEAQKITETQKAAASDAAPVQEEQLTAQTWFERGYVYAVEVKNFEEAIRCFSEAINLEPDFAEAYNNRGMAFGEKGDLDRSIADLDETIRLAPEDPIAYNNRASMRGEKGDFQNAIADYKVAISLEPNYDDAYYNLGLLYGQVIGDFDSAILNFDEAIRLNPSHASAYTNRGNARFMKGDLDGAHADFNMAISLESEHTNAYHGRAVILEQKGDNLSAIADYQKFLTLGDDIENAHRKSIEDKIKILKSKLLKK